MAKTELVFPCKSFLLHVLSRHRLNKIILLSAAHACNLGISFDSALSMDPHVPAVSKSCHFPFLNSPRSSFSQSRLPKLLSRPLYSSLWTWLFFRLCKPLFSASLHQDSLLYHIKNKLRILSFKPHLLTALPYLPEVSSCHVNYQLRSTSIPNHRLFSHF